MKTTPFHWFALSALLVLAQNASSALPVTINPIIKIPQIALTPTLQEIKLPTTIISPDILQCLKNYPEPQVFFKGKTIDKVNGVDYVRYAISINNKSDYPDSLFVESPSLPPCGLNTNAARTWALMYDQDDNYLYGFCALSSSDSLDSLWFAHKTTEKAPSTVKVVLKDRRCNKEYSSVPIGLDELSVASDAPIIAGIGLVPRTFINQSNGLATTGAEHPINVKDAPFGANLRVIGNLNRLKSLGVTSFVVGYCNMTLHACDTFPLPGFNLNHWQFVSDVRTNYVWSAALQKYVLVQETPTEIYNDGTYIFKTYPVPASSLNLYYENLLFDWLTTGQAKVPSGLYRLQLFGFNGPSLSNLVNLPISDSTMVVRIDNTPPEIKINSISYKGTNVNACSIIDLEKSTDSVDFNITATDEDGFLLNYSLVGQYGDNQTLSCTSEDYASYLSSGHSGPSWTGVSPSATKSCSGYTTSCAYAYHISGWDRAFNGYNLIHYVDYFKTLTIQVPSKPLIPIITTPIISIKSLSCGR